MENQWKNLWNIYGKMNENISALSIEPIFYSGSMNYTSMGHVAVTTFNIVDLSEASCEKPGEMVVI